ncbi:MAG: TerC family protein [Xanthobacteraceae bacterium]|jgi:predicted tellurium resistance membrane protein TerC
MPDLITNPDAWAALITLSALEIVLGIDNVVFISILTAQLDPLRSRRARAVGLSLAFAFRVLLLASLSSLLGISNPVFIVSGAAFSWRDIILIAGGLFLIAKGTREIHGEVEAGQKSHPKGANVRTLWMVILQLAIVDLVFSIDSIITAVGLADQITVMIAAVIIALIVMFFAANPVGRFIAQHPTTKMLALAFLLMIGGALLADGFHFHIPRVYIYSSMAFAALVEFLNVLARRNPRKQQP